MSATFHPSLENTGAYTCAITCAVLSSPHTDMYGIAYNWYSRSHLHMYYSSGTSETKQKTCERFAVAQLSFVCLTIQMHALATLLSANISDVC